MVKTRSSEGYLDPNRFDVCRHRRSRNVELICSDQNDTNESEDEPVKHCTRSQDRKVTIQVNRGDYSPGRTSPRRGTKKPLRYRDAHDEVTQPDTPTPTSGRYSLRQRMRDVKQEIIGNTAEILAHVVIKSHEIDLQDEGGDCIGLETPTPTSGRYSLRQRVKTELADNTKTAKEPVDAAYTSKSRREMHRRHLTSSVPSTRGHSHSYEPRRSGRTRKLLYDTFNTNLISMMSHTDNDEDEGGLSHLENLQNEVSLNEPVIQRKKRKTIEVDPMPEEEMTNMYERVKRPRRQVKRDMYGRPLEEQEEQKSEAAESSDGQGEEGSASSATESSCEEEEQPKGYSLRENKPRTQMLEINWKPVRPRRTRNFNIFHETTPPPPRRKSVPNKVYHKSPARRKRQTFRRRRAAFHGSSSTSSSSSSSAESEDDERRFERRKTKSMAKSRQRCLPMNFVPEDLNTGVLKDRSRIGGSLADIDPMSVDRSVTFESVGGLGKHVRALKEMIVFPLLYPEVFERFKIQPPRGVLFYGPPGTGKTLVARALANECSKGEKKVAFFMRKGADCLSKWVGESERQLRLLFDQAYQMRPAIIFFDEIDGLAPVRSSRQDQIHSSIVSTLLALMDGLDNRGEVVIIGATNRIDSIDPALRRPGRFDREFLFPLPSVQARKQILEIHTNQWEPRLSSDFLAELAEKCVGYCGADLKSLCTEAALHALRRRYPQIYDSEEKLQLDVTSININAHDFLNGMKCIVPASQRSVTTPARALLHSVRPLLANTLLRTLSAINRMFPKALTDLASLDNSQEDELPTDSDDEGPEIFQTPLKGKNRRRFNHQLEGPVGPFLDFSCQAINTPATHRPRMLMAGNEGQGQSTHLGPAVLHSLERMPVQVLDLPSLFAVSAKTPEESCAQVFREAKRSSPSLIYIPHMCQWWDVISEACRATFLSLLQDLEPLAPLMLLATCDVPYLDLPSQVQDLFSINSGEVILMQNPTDSERYDYFEDLLLKQACKPPPTNKKAAQRVLEQLPKAPPPEPRQLTKEEVERLRQQEEATMRELRLFLRDVLTKLGRERKFGIFSKPVDAEEVPDYFDVIEKPMDMSTMMSKIDLQKYECVDGFMKDIDLICSNALEYNPDKDPQGRIIRHRACAFKDTAEAIVKTELDLDFEKLCKEIKQSRKNRGESSKKDVPDYYFTKAISHTALDALQLDPQGLEVNDDKSTSRRRSDRNCYHSNHNVMVSQDNNKLLLQEAEELVYEEINGKKYRKVLRRKFIPKKSNAYSSTYKQSPFCRSTKRRKRNFVYYIDEEGNEFPKSELLGEGEDSPKKADEEEPEDDSVETKTLDPPPTEQVRGSGGDNKPVDAMETLTIDTSQNNMDEHDAEKENDPHSAAHSPRSRTGSGSRTRTRSFSPKGSGGEGCSLSPQICRSPRTRSPRTHSPRMHSPKNNSTHSPRLNSARIVLNHGHVKFADDEKDKISLSVDVSKEVVDITSQAVRKPPNTQSLCKTQEVNSSDTVLVNGGPVSPKTVSRPTSQGNIVAAENGPEMTAASNVLPKSPDAPKAGNSPRKASPIKMASPNVSLNKEEEMELEEGTPSSSTVGQRRTRSQTHSKQMHKAINIIERNTPALTIDTDGLKVVLCQTVDKTQGYSIEKLEKLYSVLSQCIYHHRHEYDKTQLLKELEAKVDKF